MMHCGFVGIVGLPNAGKSTFLNKVLGEKISIISSKPQTTRQSLSGLVTTTDYQLVFLDAPGFVPSRPGLFEFLAQEFEKVLEKSERLLILIPADQKDGPAFQDFMAKVLAAGKPYSILFTKDDLKATEFVESLKKNYEQEQVHWSSYSSLRKEDEASLQQFLKELAQTLPQEAQPLYDPNMISLDRTRDLVAEFIREACFNNVEQEIPFGLGVIVKSFKDQGKIVRIEANIIVDKENHKGIVIGKGGQLLKKIGKEARKEIEQLLEQKVFLGLHVSHKKNWMRKKAIMREVGYVHD